MTDDFRGHIVAMGGGGFSMEPENPLLDDFVLSLSPRQPARVCFLPTASADSATYLVRFYRAFSGRAIASDLTLIDSPSLPRRPPCTRDLAEFVAEQDVFYVGGGSTVHLLALWRAHGLERLLLERFREGAVLSGVSAGMLCWFSASITDSFGEPAPLDDGLGFVLGSACPHYDGEAGRRPAFHRAILGGMPAGYGADDGAALHFVGRELAEAVSSRPNAKVYRAEPAGERVHEWALETRYLGA